MPAQHSTRPTAQRHRTFPPAERVFHLVSAGDFERRTTRVSPSEDGDPAAGVSREVSSNVLRAGARTACCDRPVADVYAVAINKTSVTNVPWCEGAK